MRELMEVRKHGEQKTGDRAGRWPRPGLDWRRPSSGSTGRLPSSMCEVAGPGVDSEFSSMGFEAGVLFAGRRDLHQRLLQLGKRSESSAYRPQEPILRGVVPGQWRTALQGPADDARHLHRSDRGLHSASRRCEGFGQVVRGGVLARDGHFEGRTLLIPMEFVPNQPKQLSNQATKQEAFKQLSRKQLSREATKQLSNQARWHQPRRAKSCAVEGFNARLKNGHQVSLVARDSIEIRLLPGEGQRQPTSDPKGRGFIVLASGMSLVSGRPLASAAGREIPRFEVTRTAGLPASSGGISIANPTRRGEAAPCAEIRGAVRELSAKRGDLTVAH
jgi:hypothetical protein